MKPSVFKRSLTVNNRKIHVSIEHLFWTSLEEIADAQATTAPGLVASIDAARGGTGLSAAIRVYVIHHFQIQKRRLADMDDVPRRAAQRPACDDQIADDRPCWLN
jgi:predicted DNA-binding ribbon-helix-helix protein